MNKTKSTLYKGSKSIRENFFQWAAKWFYSNLPEDVSNFFSFAPFKYSNSNL
jgi:hypothetical protein